MFAIWASPTVALYFGLSSTIHFTHYPLLLHLHDSLPLCRRSWLWPCDTIRRFQKEKLRLLAMLVCSSSPLTPSSRQGQKNTARQDQARKPAPTMGQSRPRRTMHPHKGCRRRWLGGTSSPSAFGSPDA